MYESDFSDRVISIRQPLFGSLVVLSFWLVLLAWVYLRNTILIIHFFPRKTGHDNAGFGAYLDNIRRQGRQSGIRKLLFWMVTALLRKRATAEVFLRFSPGSFQITHRSRQTIAIIISMAVQLCRLRDAHHLNDAYEISRFLLVQRIPEIMVASISLWAMSWNVHKIYGSAALWSAVVVTLMWFYWRIFVLMRSLRIWAPTLPYLVDHPWFQRVHVVHPDHARLWQDSSIMVIKTYPETMSWMFQAAVGLYLFIFFQLSTTNFTGEFWIKACHILRHIPGILV